MASTARNTPIAQSLWSRSRGFPGSVACQNPTNIASHRAEVGGVLAVHQDGWHMSHQTQARSLAPGLSRQVAGVKEGKCGKKWKCNFLHPCYRHAAPAIPPENAPIARSPWSRSWGFFRLPLGFDDDLYFLRIDTESLSQALLGLRHGQG